MTKRLSDEVIADFRRRLERHDPFGTSVDFTADDVDSLVGEVDRLRAILACGSRPPDIDLDKRHEAIELLAVNRGEWATFPHGLERAGLLTEHARALLAECVRLRFRAHEVSVKARADERATVVREIQERFCGPGPNYLKDAGIMVAGFVETGVIP